MDIGAGNDYPSCALSNFARHPFTFRGVKCASMEGLLQSFKFSSPEMQKYVCTLVGRTAKFTGKKKAWHQTQTFYWNGKPIKRDSQEYQDLLDEVYDCLYQNEGFRRALAATRGATLTHSIGKSDMRRTVLTTSEFCSRLRKLRDRLNNERQPKLDLFEHD